MPYMGEIRIWPVNFAPAEWFFCQGQLLPIGQYEDFYTLIGTTYGGDGETSFGLPDLRGRVPIHVNNSHVLGESGGAEEVTLTTDQLPSHSHALRANPIDGNRLDPTGSIPAGVRGGSNRYAEAPSVPMHASALDASGGSQPHHNLMPYVALNFIISPYGLFPGPHVTEPPPDVGEIRLLPHSVPMTGWERCNGQVLPVALYQDLYGVIGNTFGGNPGVTFALPDLRGRAALHRSGAHAFGTAGGEEAHALTVNELPAHTHQLRADSGLGTSPLLGGRVPARVSNGPQGYATAADVEMDSASIGNAGGGQGHLNMQPYLALEFRIFAPQSVE